MSEFARFMKENKKVRENTKYAVTESLVDENGNPIKWELRPLTTSEVEVLRDSCTREVPVPGKKGSTKTKFNGKEYSLKLITASIVCPNLNDQELQDSYDVNCAEDLVTAMVDNPGEYDRLGSFILEFNGFKTFDEEVEEAKN